MSLESLLQQIADPEGQPPVSELVHLSNIGPEQASVFTNAWHEMELRKRRWLVDELISLAEDGVELNFDAVYFVALADRDADVRRVAIHGLWEHEGRDLIDSLVGLVRSDPDAAVRAEAALALGRFVLRAEFDDLRIADAGRVEQVLHDAVRDESEIEEVRGRALESLGARSQDWVHDLIDEAYEGADRRLRLSAVHAMGRSADAAWLPTLFLELENEDPEMRFEAAVAVGSIADEEAVPALFPLLEDEDAEVQDAAIGALGQLGGKQAREALRELQAMTEDERVREATEAALAEIEFAQDPLGFTAGA